MQPEVILIFAIAFLILSIIKIFHDKRSGKNPILGLTIAILPAIVLVIFCVIGIR